MIEALIRIPEVIPTETTPPSTGYRDLSDPGIRGYLNTQVEQYTSSEEPLDAVDQNRVETFQRLLSTLLLALDQQPYNHQSDPADTSHADETNQYQQIKQDGGGQPPVDVNSGESKEYGERPTSMQTLLERAQQEGWNEQRMERNLGWLVAEGIITHHEREHGNRVYTAVEENKLGEEQVIGYVTAQHPIHTDARGNYAVVITIHSPLTTQETTQYSITMQLGMSVVNQELHVLSDSFTTQQANNGDRLVENLTPSIRNDRKAKTTLQFLNGSGESMESASGLAVNVVNQLMPTIFHQKGYLPDNIPTMFSYLQDPAIAVLLSEPSITQEKAVPVTQSVEEIATTERSQTIYQNPESIIPDVQPSGTIEIPLQTSEQVVREEAQREEARALSALLSN